MSIPFSGTITRSGGVISAIMKQVKSVNLKAVKRISIQFDPFAPNVTHTRDFMFFLNKPKVLATNLDCKIKTEIVCDRSDPVITCNLLSGEKVTFKSFNLTTLELFQLLNQHVSSLAPVPEVIVEVKTKSSKKAGKQR
ncbi:39S ribosomal protein L53, mitochondrial [Athalia rosae]|uniref:39S ribosomal protein L53, mitochondrial n=1 Tax=Athalia rosae TaxID=37344 RepID=UPI002034910C|nr:39S ribosomal protein L53, mitochondrial [Athalia rosae]